MQLLTTFTAIFTLICVAIAQNSSISASNNYGLDISSVDLSLRQYWCDQQTAQCPLICAETNNNDTSTIQNSCVPTSLSYQCVCSNNKSPNATQYTQTIPFFECTTAGDQCINKCPQGDGNCQNNCRASRVCAATSPKKYNTTTSTATSSSAVTSATGDALNGAGTSAASSRFGPSAGLLALLTMVTGGIAVLL